MGQKNIIELNGKRYDAITGAFLGTASTSPATGSRASHHGRVIDGFVKKSAPSKVHAPAIKPAAKPAQPTQRTVAKTGKIMEMTVVKKPAASRTAPKHAKPHQPERAKTLMRHVVKKPNPTLKPNIKTQAPTELAPASIKAIAPKLEIKKSVEHVDPVRARRAHAAVRSQHIRRFHALPSGQQAGASLPHSAQTRPVTPPTARPQPPVQRAIHHQAPVRPASAHIDIFEAAIAHATSHEQPAPPRRRKLPRLASITVGVAAFLIVGGFIAYANMPGIELQIASTRAGFSANMPSYKPMGFTLGGPIESSKGKVVMRFASGDSSYTLSQESSDWDSQTLLDNKVAAADPSHQTVESKGRIIYIYNNTNATWVNGGVRYEVTSTNGALDAQEMVELATSI